MPYARRLLRHLLALPLLGALPYSHAEVDESLASALDSLWSAERPTVSLLSARFTDRESKAGVAYQADTKHSPIYLMTGAENAALLFGRKRFDATATPWGNFPPLAMGNARLLEVNLPKRHYQVLIAPGKGLFAVGDWQRYAFLHVLDVSKGVAPAYYPLLAEANLGEHVLGHLPGSPVLNYARLVPSGQNAGSPPDEYEVSLYALARNGAQRVTVNGRPVAYSLKRTQDGWNISPATSTPVTNARDEERRPFTAPSRPSLFVKGTKTTPAQPAVGQ